MSQARDNRVTLETRKQIARFSELGWYHSIELPDGNILEGFLSIEHLKARIARFPIPQDLRGKRVLDIGAWDGWFSFEMERRGADVVALDSTSNPKLLVARDLLGSKIEYVVADIQRVSPRDLGKFDIVLFFGVLYHLKHPMLALEKVCELATEMACVESYVIDNGADPQAVPVMEFYETGELRGQLDNWTGPNTSCLLAMARSAGFARVTLEGVIEQRAHVTCMRRWQDQPGQQPPPALICLENNHLRDHTFRTDADDYVSIWLETESTALNCDNIFVEIDGYGARPIHVACVGPKAWHATCKLSPGLDCGWRPVRARVQGSQYSNAIPIPVDLPPDQRLISRDRPGSSAIGPGPIQLRIDSIWDGQTWERSRVNVGVGSCLSIWVQGIPEGCGRGSLMLRLDQGYLAASYVSEADANGLRQVNAMLPSGFEPGPSHLAIICEGETSLPIPLELVSKT